jgi:2-polyprenyl-3-methyl-5-hydroxy-6-metoxy-1,4-benzoquinol methylase
MAVTDFDARAATWDDDPAKRARASAVAAAIRRRVDLATRPRALEFGAGTGLLSFELAKDLGSALLVDTSRGMLAVADAKIAATGARHLATRLADLASGPLGESEFDLVYSMMTLHHVPDTEAILRTFHDLLVPGGALAIADLDAEDGSFHGAGVDVHHGFDRARLRQSLEAAGFRDVAFDTCFELERGDRVYPVFLVTARAG